MKKIKSKYKRISLLILVVVLIIIGFLVLQGLIIKSKKHQVVVRESIETQSYDKNNFYVEINKSKQWHEGNGETGAQYDGCFFNNSQIDVSNWIIEIVVPEKSYIDSSWNGNYEMKDNLIQITPVDYNSTISKNGFETFGFVMYTKKPFNVETVTVYGHKSYRKEDFMLYWVLIFITILTIIFIMTYIIYEHRVQKYKMRQEEDREIILQSLNTFANFIDAKDPYTKGHSTRVALYAREIARRMGLPEEVQDHLSFIALLHDVGKVGIPNEILNKPATLTSEERNYIEMHTNIGSNILKDFTALPGIQDGARYHHEWYDGTGYPTGIFGESIPLFARIICVADSYDTMSSDRCYRKKLEESEILKELKGCSGTQFDPEIVKYMIEMIQDGFVTLVRNGEIVS